MIVRTKKPNEVTALEEFIAYLEAYLTRPGSKSVAELAEAAGISRIYVYKIKRGESEPSLTVAMKLAKAMGASISEICPENSVAYG